MSRFKARKAGMDWLVVAAVLLVITSGIALFLWSYDFDVKCLIAECRRIK